MEKQHMTKILIAIDGSKSSIKAIEYVVKRRRRGEHIESYFLNVQPAISPKAGLITRGMIRDYQTLESQKALGKPEVEAMKRYLKADTYLEVGDPASCIIDFATKTKCDEIVIGSRGLGGIKGVFLGSVANKVVQMCSVPVVVVK
jgi:nucleotide-binding universal stress UspA family protein